MPEINLPNFLEELEKDTQHSQRLPVEVLNETAAQLASRTGGYVLGSVFLLHPADSNLFRYTFYLRMPKLDDYTDPLFYVWHRPDPYPATLLPSGGKLGTDEILCGSEEDLEREINSLFNKAWARERIETLIRLARAQRAN